MDHFLIYIIVSSLVTLVSIMSAYKPEDEELRFADFGSNELECNSEQPMKKEGATSANNLQMELKN